VISKENEKFSVQQFDKAWRPESARITSVNETGLSITHQARGYKLIMTVTRQGDALSGTSKLVHVQASKEQKMGGRRVVKANHWDPLEGVRKLQDAAGLADVASALRKDALARNLEQFMAAWDSEIGGPYYVFIDRFWDPDPAQKTEKLRRLYQLLRSNQFAKNLKTAVSLRTQVVQGIKDKLPSYYFTNPTIVVPSLSSADVSAIDVVEGKVHIRMEIPEKLPAVAQSRLKWLIAREHIQMVFLVNFPLQTRTAPIELIRRGIAGYLAADLVKVSLPELLGTTPAKSEAALARVDSYRKAIVEIGNTEAAHVRLTSPGEPLTGRQIVDMVSYKFGEQVSKRFKPEEIAKLDRDRLLELIQNYLKAGG